MVNIRSRISELTKEYKSVTDSINQVNRKLGELEKRRIELEAVITELYNLVEKSGNDDTEN